MRTVMNLLPWMALAAFSQAPSPSPSFEVAVVKPSPSPSGPFHFTGGPGTDSPGEFRAANMTLNMLLTQAYGLRSDRIDGPSWLQDDKFDVEAKIPPNATREQVRQMLQSLLVERVGLIFHWETRDFPSYELTVAKGGLKMKEAEPPQGELPPIETGARPADRDGFPILTPGRMGLSILYRDQISHLSARMQTAQGIRDFLSSLLHAVVIDKTGLTGTYDFKLLYAPPNPPPAPSSEPQSILNASMPAPDVSSALEKQLGLKLEAKKSPMQVLVVDKANRKPTPN